MQGDLATARAFLDEIAAAQRGEQPQPGGVGNAFSIAIGPDGAVIRNAVLEDAVPEQYSLGEIARRARDLDIRDQGSEVSIAGGARPSSRIALRRRSPHE